MTKWRERIQKVPDPKSSLSTLIEKSCVFKFFHSRERIKKNPFSRIFLCGYVRCNVVDGRPNRSNKVAFSNLSCIVWTRPFYCWSWAFFFHKVFNCLYLFLIFELESPVVATNPRNQTVFEGRTAEINCTAKGIPRPELSWTIENGKPTPGDAVIRNSSNQSTLQLSNTSKTMEGWYTCKAKNKGGVAFSNSTLHVLGLFWFIFVTWQASWVGKIERYWPLRIEHFVPAITFRRSSECTRVFFRRMISLTVKIFSVISLSEWN